MQLGSPSAVFAKRHLNWDHCFHSIDCEPPISLLNFVRSTVPLIKFHTLWCKKADDCVRDHSVLYFQTHALIVSALLFFCQLMYLRPSLSVLLCHRDLLFLLLAAYCGARRIHFHLPIQSFVHHKTKIKQNHENLRALRQLTPLAIFGEVYLTASFHFMENDVSTRLVLSIARLTCSVLNLSLLYHAAHIVLIFLLLLPFS